MTSFITFFFDLLTSVGYFTIIFCFSIICEVSVLLVGVIHMDHFLLTSLAVVLFFLCALVPGLRYTQPEASFLVPNDSQNLNLGVNRVFFAPNSVRYSAIGNFIFFFLNLFFIFFLSMALIYFIGSTFADFVGVTSYIMYIFESRYPDPRSIFMLITFIWEPLYTIPAPIWIKEFSGSWELFETLSDYFSFTVSGLLLSLLSVFLYTVLLYSLTTPPLRTNQFYFFYVISIVSLFICFLTDHFFVFYLSFEFILIPFFVIVGVWGSRVQRLGASLRLVFFTVLFSLPLVTVMFMNLINETFSFSFESLNSTLFPLGYHFNTFFYLAAFFAFAVKIPLFPAHVWLPEAHGEAPTFGSVLLAGILLKLGGFGFLQVGFPLFNDFSFDSCMSFFPFVYTISVLTIIYSNISVFVQVDIKKTIAYYSIGHMGFVTLGLCSGAFEGFVGAMVIMVAHGLSAAGLFFLVGFLYEKTHTRALFAYRGVSTVAPIFSFFMFIFICANMGLPGTMNFAGEQLVLVSLIKFSSFSVILPLFGVLLNGISSILFINRLIFGETNDLVATHVSDVKATEFIVYFLIAVPLVFFGFFPNMFTALLIA